MMWKLKKDNCYKLLFFFIVIIPFVLSLIYYLFLATNVYITETKFIVKTLNNNHGNNLNGFLQTFGIIENTSKSNSLIIIDYIKSKNTMYFLDQEYNIKAYFSSNKWDILQRFNPLRINSSYEYFYEYLNNMGIISFYLDNNSNVITMQIKTENPDIGYNISKSILNISEAFINDLNKKSAISHYEYFEKQLNSTRDKIRIFTQNLTNFMKKNQIVSSDQQIASYIQRITKLQELLTSKQIELNKMVSLTPQNPRIAVLEKEINDIQQDIKTNIDITINKINPKMIELDIMKNELLILQKELEINTSEYLQSKHYLMLKQIYLSVISPPIKPDAALLPNKTMKIFSVLLISFAIWGILSILIMGIKEHSQS